jgi:hypothetical protein
VGWLYTRGIDHTSRLHVKAVQRLPIPLLSIPTTHRQIGRYPIAHSWAVARAEAMVWDGLGAIPVVSSMLYGLQNVFLLLRILPFNIGIHSKIQGN